MRKNRHFLNTIRTNINLCNLSGKPLSPKYQQHYIFNLKFWGYYIFLCFNNKHRLYLSEDRKNLQNKNVNKCDRGIEAKKKSFKEEKLKLYLEE